ncbi:hypothetical protein QS257_14915 [Terrilactibacillus sp. S3-3]|nr:hypothetical protein QS257_14915 [Terrilactibacillus sp. S3-3]
MSEEKKKPRVIHVDNLIIKANEVTFQQEPAEDQPSFQGTNFQGFRVQGPFQNQGFQGQGSVDGRQIQRDFWGFPIPQSFDGAGQPLTDGTEADGQSSAEDK